MPQKRPRAPERGRKPRYHLNFGERQDWMLSGEPMVPLKGYPGVVRERPKTKKRMIPAEFG